jgi:nucleoside-diphosphate-sugar epimerase
MGKIFYLFGPNEYQSRFIPSIIRSYLQGETAQVSHGNQIRDYLYVKDVARAFSSLCSSEFNGAINIGSGQPVNLRYMVDIIRNIIGDAFSVHYSDYSPFDDDFPIILADSKKIRENLKWCPNYSLYEGLKETIDWWMDSYKQSSI